MDREAREGSGKAIQDAYLKIHENFLRENYADVDSLANSYLAGSRPKPNSEDVLYLHALSLLKLNRADEARSKLRQLENTFTSQDRKASASASIADSYYYEGNFLKGAEAYKETLKKYPQSDQTTYVLYRLRELSQKPVNPKFSTPALPLRQVALEEAPFFSVQVGSFAKVRNANALMNKLIHRQYSAYIDRDPRSILYRVRVGRLASKSEAAALESRLKNEGYPTKITP